MLDLIFFTPAHNLTSTVCIGIVGLIVGSFLNVVIHRIPKMMQREIDNFIAEETGKELPHTDRYNLMVPRSACPRCGHQIMASENIPVISYLMLGGKCSECKLKISPRYPVIEALTGALTAFLIWHFGSDFGGLGAVVFAWFMIALTCIDLDTKLLPDSLTLPLLWLGLLVNWHGAYFASLNHAVIGAVAGYLSLWSVYWLFKIITHKEGMGYGDFKLLAALGAWMGWMNLPLIILMSSLVGAVVGLTLIVSKKLDKENPIPFGPYLAIAGMIALVWGKQINAEYLGLFN